GVRFVDPAAARIAAIENDFQDASLLLPVRRRDRGRVAEFLEQDLDHALELALLRRWQMVEIGTHQPNPNQRARRCNREAKGLAPELTGPGAHAASPR